MTSRLTEQVTELARIYQIPLRAGAPSVAFPRIHLSLDLIAEEFSELVAAIYGHRAGDAVLTAVRDAVATSDEGTRDVVAAADALADLSVVTSTLALEAAIPIDPLLDEVHRSNLSKLGADGQPVRDERGKVVKGPNYSPPDVAGVLGFEPR